MYNHYDLEDEQLIDLNYIDNRNQDEPHTLDEPLLNIPSINTDTINNNNSINNNNNNSINNNNNNSINNRIPNNRHNIQLIHSQHIQNKMTRKIIINTLYISLLASIGLCINLFSYNDIIHNSTNINSATITFNFNVDNAYYYIVIALAFYACYIGITILMFACCQCINTNKITIIRAITTNNIIYTCIILLRIIQFYVFTIYILTDTYILQVNVNKTITINNTVNVYIPLYIELSMLDTILQIFIFYMIGKTTGIINVYNKYSLQ